MAYFPHDVTVYLAFSRGRPSGAIGSRREPSRHPTEMKANGKVGLTHRTSEEREDEYEELLPYRQYTQVDGGETGHSRSADADEEGVRV